MLNTVTDQAFAVEPNAALQVVWLLQQAAQEKVNSARAWAWLEAAHIVGQTRFALHWRVHAQMLRRAWAERNFTEVFAQILRLALIPLGHLFQRLPLGNPGSSRVGALTPLSVPPNLASLISQSRSFILEKQQ
jgi:hypothetical protein